MGRAWLAIAVAFTAGCAVAPLQAPARAGVAPLVGRVQWPHGRALQATEASVVDTATVSLIEATTGDTKLSGVTDASGAFSLIDDSANPTFNPSVNQLFILEAVKGLPASGLAAAPGEAAARLRTIARYTGGSPVWESASASGGTHYINEGTTALAVALAARAYDPSAASPNAYDRAISSFTAPSTFLGTTEVATAEQAHVMTLVQAALETNDLDPVGAIAFRNGQYMLLDPANPGLWLGLLNNTACSANNFTVPGGMCFSQDFRYLYVTNNAANQMKVIKYDTTNTTGGGCTLFSGAGPAGSTDGASGTARFSAPRGICADQQGNLYVADSGTHIIRRVDSTGAVVTLAGLAGSTGTADGTGTTARFNAPIGITTDGQGNLYVGEQGNNLIRKVVIGTGAANSGVVTTLNVTTPAPGDVTALTCDGQGNLYFVDSAAATGVVKRIAIASPATSTNIAGRNAGTTAFSATGTLVRMGANLRDLCYDGQRFLYASDATRARVWRIDTLHPTYATGHVAGTGTAGTTAGYTGASTVSAAQWGLAFNPLTRVLYLADGTLLRRFQP